LQESKDPRAAALLQHYFSFPSNLPMFSHYRPPLGNSRPGGIAQSCHGRALRGELPEVY